MAFLDETGLAELWSLIKEADEAAVSDATKVFVKVPLVESMLSVNVSNTTTKTAASFKLPTDLGEYSAFIMEFDINFSVVPSGTYQTSAIINAYTSSASAIKLYRFNVEGGTSVNYSKKERFLFIGGQISNSYPRAFKNEVINSSNELNSGGTCTVTLTQEINGCTSALTLSGTVRVYGLK